MIQVGMHEAKTKLSQLVERAEAGEDIVIARNGKPVARLVPISRPIPSPLFGLFGARCTWPTTSTSCPDDSPKHSASVEAAAGHACRAVVSQRRRASWRRCERHLENEANQVLLSAAVVWEIAIKRSSGSWWCRRSTSHSCLTAGLSCFRSPSNTRSPSRACHGITATRSTAARRPGLDRRRRDRLADESLRPYGVPIVW